MNNNIPFDRAISNLHIGQTLIHFYGSHAIKIEHDAQGQEQVVLKPLPERIALYIHAALIYYTGTAQYFNATIVAHQNEQLQLEDFLNRNFTVITNEIGQLEGRRSAAILQNGRYDHMTKSNSTCNKMEGWNTLNAGESAFMRYAGYGFAPNWKTGHTFSQVQINKVDTYNNLNCFLYAKAHIADCTDNALIYFMHSSKDKRNEIIDLLPLDRLKRLASCPNHHIADACKQKIITLVLDQLQNENWPDDAVELLRQGQYSPWLNEIFKNLGYQNYEKNSHVFTSIGEMITFQYYTAEQCTALKALLYKLVKIVDINSAIYTIDVELQVFAILCKLFTREINVHLHTYIAPFIRNETVGEIFFKSASHTIKTACCEHIKKHYQETKESLLEKSLTRFATTERQYAAITQFLDSCAGEKPVELITQSIQKLNVPELLFMAIDKHNYRMESCCFAILLQERTLLEKFLTDLTTQEPNVERKLEKEDLEKLQLGLIDKYIKYYVHIRTVVPAGFATIESHFPLEAPKLLEQAITYSDNALNLIYQTIKKLDLESVYRSCIALPHAFDNEVFSDLTITIQDMDGKSLEVKVNSTLLSARYKDFAKFLKQALGECLEVTVSNIEAMKDIMEFFYIHDFPSGIGYQEWSIYCEIARKYNATQLIGALCREAPSYLNDHNMNYFEAYFWLLQNTSEQSFIEKMCEYFVRQLENNLDVHVQKIHSARKILHLAEATMREVKGLLVIELKNLIQKGIIQAIACLMYLNNKRDIAAKNLAALIKEYHMHIEELDCTGFYRENSFLPDLFAALPNLRILRVGRDNTVSSQLALALKQHAKKLELVDLSGAVAVNLIESDKIFATLDVEVLTEDYSNGYDLFEDANNSDEKKNNDALPENAEIAKSSDQKSANNLD